MIINIIFLQIIKLYGWEHSFLDQVSKIRWNEIQILKNLAYLSASTSFLWSCAPFIVSLLTFACYLIIDETNTLDAEKAFVSLSLFNILRFPLSMLPKMIENIVQVISLLLKLAVTHGIIDEIIEHNCDNIWVNENILTNSF